MLSSSSVIASVLYFKSEEKGRTVSVFTNEDFSPQEKLIVSSEFVKPEMPPSVWMYDGISVNKTSNGEKIGEVSASSRIFINSNLSLD